MFDLAALQGWTWILIRFIWLITFLLSVAVFFLIIYLSKVRRRLASEELAATALVTELEEKVVEYLFASPTDTNNRRQKIADDLQSVAADEDRRGILVSIIIKLQRNISGDLLVTIRRLFADLGLVEYALDKLNSRNWGEVLGGILQLTEMERAEADARVSVFLDHPRSEVRSAALLFEFRVFQFRGLDTILSLDEPLSEWDQIRLLERIRYFEGQEVPDVRNLLTRKNPTLLLFGLKLSRLFNLRGARKELVIMLKSDHKEIRMEVQRLLAHLGAVDAKKDMKAEFVAKDEEERICVIRALEMIIDEGDEPFLISLLQDPSQEVKYYAGQMLQKLKPKIPRSDLFEIKDITLSRAV